MNHNFSRLILRVNLALVWKVLGCAIERRRDTMTLALCDDSSSVHVIGFLLRPHIVKETIHLGMLWDLTFSFSDIPHQPQLSPHPQKMCTPLHIAARYNHTEVCRFLMSQGADAQAKDTVWTPLTIPYTAIASKHYFAQPCPVESVSPHRCAR